MAKFRTLKKPATSPRPNAAWNLAPPGAKSKKAKSANSADAADSVLGIDAAEPMPRAFQRILSRLSGKKLPRGDNGEALLAVKAASGVVKTTKALTRRKGETISHFNRRVDDDSRNKVNAAAHAETKTAQKRKTKLQERKEKLKEKRRKGKTSAEELVQERMDGRDTIFGTQASEPPSFSVVPKKVGGGAGAQRALAKLLAKKDKDGDNEAGDKRDKKEKKEVVVEEKVVEAGPGRKTKLKNLPMSQQKIIGEERLKAIELYRQAKLTKDRK